MNNTENKKKSRIKWEKKINPLHTFTMTCKKFCHSKDIKHSLDLFAYTDELIMAKKNWKLSFFKHAETSATINFIDIQWGNNSFFYLKLKRKPSFLITSCSTRFQNFGPRNLTLNVFGLSKCLTCLRYFDCYL